MIKNISIANTLTYIILFLAGFLLMNGVDNLFHNVDGGFGIKVFIGYLFTTPYTLIKD